MEELKAENERLKARIKELESELAPVLDARRRRSEATRMRMMQKTKAERIEFARSGGKANTGKRNRRKNS